MLPRTKTEPRPVILGGEAQKILRGQCRTLGRRAPRSRPRAGSDVISRGIDALDPYYGASITLLCWLCCWS
jgi:hypothetical protein